MAATTIRLDDSLYERLRQYSFVTRIPMARVIEAALSVYLDLIEEVEVRDGSAG